MCLADGASEVRAAQGRAVTDDRRTRGDFVSLLPLAPVADGVTTEGLDYPLSDEPLEPGPARGLSNVYSGEQATVSSRTGRLLVIHTRLEQ